MVEQHHPYSFHRSVQNVQDKQKLNINRNLHRLKLIEQKLNIQTLDDWYNIRYNNVKKNGGSSLLNSYNGSISSMLKSLYPDHTWQMTRFVAAHLQIITLVVDLV